MRLKIRKIAKLVSQKVYYTEESRSLLFKVLNQAHNECMENCLRAEENKTAENEALQESRFYIQSLLPKKILFVHTNEESLLGGI